MKIIIKSLVLFTVLFLSSREAFAQEKNNATFSVISKSKITNVEPYVKAVEAANFSCYHLRKTRRKITFDTGVVIELFSITEMMGKGVKFNASCIADESKLEKNPPIYNLSETGIIMELHDDVRSYQKHP
ncbi:MAG: hypothetical protein A3F72_05520 [Bacteroidetes bacterium RIFCSPLOWO2_12_FULL_35_15]|nr:MAG: hypothetical protein A3F72_05520 [Bacteroidetes bacterium RIFCSPLOWO2_12_FULL_35_15]